MQIDHGGDGEGSTKVFLTLLIAGVLP
jgi:hypothetical protein